MASIDRFRLRCDTRGREPGPVLRGWRVASIRKTNNQYIRLFGLVNQSIDPALGAPPEVPALFQPGQDSVALGNRLVATSNGILMEDTGTAYRDNFVLQIPAGATAFSGGVDAGGNVSY